MPIYMDYSATTPVDTRVAQKMIPYLTENFGNPASRSHSFGWTAEQAVENAREEVARLVNCDPKEIVWTSGATESDNLAIKGAAHFYQGKGKHLITMKTEHKAVIDMGEAFRIAREEMATENERIRMLRDRLYNGLKDMEEVYVNGDMEQRIPHNLNISFNYVEGESLMMAIKDLAVSSGSACTSASLEPSYVLKALGHSDELAHSSIRFSIGRFTTEEEVDYAIQLLKSKIARLRELSPLWDMHMAGIDLSSVQWAAH
jgi:cysteine sulfinate desulfinase/cysteine desulfurase-like protein